MISINRIADERASFFDGHALEEDFAFAELEVEATILFEGVLQFREYELHQGRLNLFFGALRWIISLHLNPSL